MNKEKKIIKKQSFHCRRRKLKNKIKKNNTKGADNLFKTHIRSLLIPEVIRKTRILI